MNRRIFAKTASLAVLAIDFAGCVGNSGNGGGDDGNENSGRNQQIRGSSSWYGLSSCDAVDATFKIRDAKLEMRPTEEAAVVIGVVEHIGVEGVEATLKTTFYDDQGDILSFDKTSGYIEGGSTDQFEHSYRGGHWGAVNDFKLEMEPSACH